MCRDALSHGENCFGYMTDRGRWCVHIHEAPVFGAALAPAIFSISLSNVKAPPTVFSRSSRESI